MRSVKKMYEYPDFANSKAPPCCTSEIHECEQEEYGPQDLKSNLYLIEIEDTASTISQDIAFSAIALIGSTRKRLLIVHRDASYLRFRHILSNQEARQSMVLIDWANDPQFCSFGMKLLEAGCDVCFLIEKGHIRRHERRSPISVLIRSIKGAVGGVNAIEINIWREFMFRRIKNSQYCQYIKRFPIHQETANEVWAHRLSRRGV